MSMLTVSLPFFSCSGIHRPPLPPLLPPPTPPPPPHPPFPPFPPVNVLPTDPTAVAALKLNSNLVLSYDPVTSKYSTGGPTTMSFVLYTNLDYNIVWRTIGAPLEFKKSLLLAIAIAFQVTLLTGPDHTVGPLYSTWGAGA